MNIYMKILYLPLLTLLMSFISLDVYAYDIEVTNDQGVTIYYNYIKDNTELEVCYGEESYSGSVVIPEKVIYQNKSYCVTSIGEYAFNGCTGLISVSIPNNLISIGEYAFMNCESLTSISIPNSVVYIGEWAFGSSGLTSITIPNSVTSICDGAFSYCTGLTSITIPNSVTSIGEYTFADCSSLTSITIPNSVTSIGEYAFEDCSGLISITIPQSVTSIRESAFLGCGALTTITINSCEISIGENTFMNCTSVTDVYCYTEPAKIEWQGHFFPSSFVKFHVFDKTSYETKFPNAGVDFDEGLRTIVCNGITYEIISTIDKTAKVIADKEGYKGDIEMAASIVSNNVTYSVVAIDEKAFSDCSDLTSVSIPNSVTSIGSEAFLECTGLTSLTIPNSVVSIGREAFRNCFGLTSITIPNSVTSIGEYAFDWCENLTSVTLSSNLTTIEEGLFIDCTSLSSITIPSSVTSIWDNAFYGCDALESIIVEEGNDVYDSRENCNAIIKSETNRLVFGCKNTVIPNTVVTIGQLAFKNCSGLTSIVIPNSVISIEEEAFAWCSDLISVTIGSGVASIKNNAFAFCHKLEKVIISDISAWCAISFENGDSNPLCRARHLYSDENTEITNLEIPSGVTSIGSYAFLNCEGLTSLNIPSGVTSVSNNAFYGCKNLVTMTINSSEISIAENVFMNCGSITDVYCYTESEKMEWAGRFFPSKGFVKFHVFDKAAYVTKFPNAAVSFDDGLRTIVNEGITYKIISTTDKTAQVVAGKEKYEGDIIIPASVVSDNNVTYSVVAIGDKAFSQCSDLISVTIPNSVTSIGERAFYSSGITSITIPNNVCSLGESVFDDCSGLISVVISNSVTSISNYAFSRCSSLTSVTIPNSVTSIGENAFYECSSLASVTIPNSVESIGAGAFNWSGLTSVSIPNSVTSIGEFAFGSCENLEKVIVPDISAWCSIDFESESSNPLCYGHHIYSDEDTEMTKLDIPSGVTSINKYAFYNCESLTSVTIPNSVSSIGNDAFHNCDNMTSLTINSDVISIVQDAFKESSSVTEVYCYTTPENMEWTGWFFPSSYDVKFYVFDKAAYEAKFPNAGVEFDERLLVYGGVVYKIISTTDKTAKVIANEEGYKGDIEIAASFDCNNVTYSVVAIDDKAFYDCDELTSVIIPTSVKSIGYQAFLNCNRMTFITIPDGIASIEDGTFASCNSLTSIVIPNSVKSIGNWAFESCGFQSLTIGNNVESIGSYAFTGCSSLVSITISNNITSIAEGTFSNCSNLTSFVMPDNITSIGEQAFYNCSSLTSIVIPNGVTSVESFAFLNCENLTSIEIPSSVIFLGAGAFSGCKNLATISINSSKISISKNSFSSCQNIETITISSSEISFDENVFMSCSSIADVYCYTEPEKVEWQGRFFPSKAFVKFHVFDKAAYVSKFPNAGVIFDDGLRTIVSDGITYEIISTTDKTAKVIAGEEGYKGDIEIAASFDCNNVVYSVVAIDKEAFSGCSDLTSVIIPNSVTSIGEHAFDNCIALESIIVEEGNDVYDSRNNCNAIIETGTNKLLYGCKNTVIPNSVLTIGQSAFSGCSKLTSIDIPNSVTSIGESAFYICGDLTSVSIPNGVTSIGSAAFCHCSRLTSITIPNSVTSIGDYAFDGCDGLTSVTVNMDQPVSISEGVFPNRANATLYVPAGSKAAYQAAAYWNDFKEIVEIGMDLPADELFSGTNLWAGYVAQEDLIPGTGLKVYVITKLGTTTATASQIDYMPQGVPVLLKRADTTVSSYEVTSGTGTAPTTNLLRVFNADRNVSNREGFILFNDEFVLVNEGVLPAGRVFLPANNLQLSRGMTRSIVIDDDDATGIEDLEESPAVEEPYDVYDLSGRKVANQVTSLDGLPHGIYIVNGKKILKR